LFVVLTALFRSVMSYDNFHLPRLKLVPGRGEKISVPITVTPRSLAQIQAINVRTGPNFSTFRLMATAPGTAKLYAGTDINKVAAGPVTVIIEQRISLPAASTDVGLLARLFLAETPSPEMPGYNNADAETAMTWMRAVVGNRLAKPSHLYGSAGAKTVADVVRAKASSKGLRIILRYLPIFPSAWMPC
jgi:hypothetical protein